MMWGVMKIRCQELGLKTDESWVQAGNFDLSWGERNGESRSVMLVTLRGELAH